MKIQCGARLSDQDLLDSKRLNSIFKYMFKTMLSVNKNEASIKQPMLSIKKHKDKYILMLKSTIDRKDVNMKNIVRVRGT